MTDYYSVTCKNCGEDCDSKFCSEDCREEWESGYADYLYEQAKDRRLEEDAGWL